MNKELFLFELQKALYGLPQADIEERLAFYSEMIDDRMEEGMSEEEAVAAAGPIYEIVQQALSEIPLKKLVKEKITPKEGRSGGEIALLILGFPIWFPLLIAGAVIIFSLFIVIWAVVISLWAAQAALSISAGAAIITVAVYIIKGHLLMGVAIFGLMLVTAGIAMLMYLAVSGLTKGAAALSKKLMLGIKALFVKK